MAKKKQQPEEQKQEPAAELESPEAASQDAADVAGEPEEVEAEDAAKMKAEAEDAALKRVCKALGVSYEEVLKKEKEAPKPEPLCEVDLGRHICRINGIRYTGIVRGPRGMIEMLAGMAGARRMRLIEEMIGRKGEVSLVSEGIQTRVIGTMEQEQQ